METHAENPGPPASPSPVPPGVPPRGGWWKIVPVLVMIVGAVLYVRTHPQAVEGLRGAIAAAGVWGPILYIAIHTSRSITWIPGNILSPLGGLLFGFWKGLLFTWIGLMGACIVAFAIARWLRPPTQSGPVARRFHRLLSRFEGKEWVAVAIARLVPGIPFNVSSYLSGATHMSWTAYLVASGIGIIPRMAIQVALGAGVYAVGTGGG